jgi:TonB family protein
MTLTIKDSLEAAGTPKSGSPGQGSANPPGQSTRSNPVCLEVPVIVRRLPGEGGSAAGPTRQEGRSVIVFDNGGVLRLGNSLPVGQKVILTNQQGRDVVSRVVGGRNLPSIKGYIEVEFIEPVSDFWQIHKVSEAPQVPPVSALDSADVDSILPSPVVPRVSPAVPEQLSAAAKKPDSSPPGAPTFDDIAGLVSMPPEPELGARKNETPIPARVAQPADASPRNSIEAPRIAPEKKSTISFSELQVEKLADSTTPAGFPIAARQQPLSNDSGGRAMTFSGMSSLPAPDESRGRMPMYLGGAVLVLAALGGGYFFLHRGASPVAEPAAVAAVSQPAAPATDPSAAPAPQPAAEQTPVQPASAAPVVSSPAEVAPPVPASSQSARLRVDNVESRPAERTAVPRPKVANLKMNSPTKPGKNLSSGSDGSSLAPVDVAIAVPPVEAAPGTFGARTDKQPAPPPDSPAEIPTARAPKSVQGAKLLSSTRPVYPPLAKQSRTQGRVTIDLSIDDKGNVAAAKIVSGPIPLRQAALDAVKHWKYSPALIDGKPSPSELSIGVDFRLN